MPVQKVRYKKNIFVPLTVTNSAAAGLGQKIYAIKNIWLEPWLHKF
jgi:hypothetical protein